MQVTLPCEKIYTCIGEGKRKKAWQEQALLCMVLFYNHLSCYTLWRWQKENSICFTIYFRSSPKVNVNELENYM